MQDSVLTLGEKIVLAARLASIEHVRQELAEAAQRADPAKRGVGPVGDRPVAVTEDPDAFAFTRPVHDVLGDIFGRLELTTVMPAKPKARPNARRQVRGAA